MRGKLQSVGFALLIFIAANIVNTASYGAVLYPGCTTILLPNGKRTVHCPRSVPYNSYGSVPYSSYGSVPNGSYGYPNWSHGDQSWTYYGNGWVGWGNPPALTWGEEPPALFPTEGPRDCVAPPC
jgi:hypothetical protein